jgi:hypothetical protein
MKSINRNPKSINVLAPKSGSKEINAIQPSFDLGIERDTDVDGIGMGVLSDGTPYLNQRGLAALCGVENAHIGTISSQWNDEEQKPRIQSIKGILQKIGSCLPSSPCRDHARGTDTLLLSSGNMLGNLRILCI